MKLAVVLLLSVVAGEHWKTARVVGANTSMQLLPSIAGS